MSILPNGPSIKTLCIWEFKVLVVIRGSHMCGMGRLGWLVAVHSDAVGSHGGWTHGEMERKTGQRGRG